MAVIVAPRSGGLLGTLGTIAGIGGTMFGQPWLGALGMGMNAANAAMNGSPGGVAEAMAGILNGDLNGMQGMMANNIARTDEANAAIMAAQNMAQAAPYGGLDQDVYEAMPPVGQSRSTVLKAPPPVGQTYQPGSGAEALMYPPVNYIPWQRRFRGW